MADITPSFDSSSPLVLKVTKELQALYDAFKSEQVFLENRTVFFTNTEDSPDTVSVANVQGLEAKRELANQHAPELILFYLDIIDVLQDIQRELNVQISTISITELVKYIKPLIVQMGSPQSLENIIASELIKRRLQSIISIVKSEQLQSKLYEVLAKLIMQHPNLRNFKTFSEVKSSGQPVDRIVLLAISYLVNDEALENISMLLESHKSENMISIVDYKEIEKVNEYNQRLGKKFILQLIGHENMQIKGNNIDRLAKKAKLFAYSKSMKDNSTRLIELVANCQQIADVQMAIIPEPKKNLKSKLF